MSRLSSIKPDITSMVDTEQHLSRSFDVDASSGDYDLDLQYRTGTWRPLRVELVYRVNRGANAPVWYLFTVRILVAKVLKGGEVSTAYLNKRSEHFNPEKAPGWARELGMALMPRVSPEV